MSLCFQLERGQAEWCMPRSGRRKSVRKRQRLPQREDALEPLSERVLLVGWGGADSKSVDALLRAGQMPNLQRLIDTGVRGDVASPTPMISPTLWTSVATGKKADQHGILCFAGPETGDGVATGKTPPVASRSRRCKAVWNILSGNDVLPLRRLRSCVVNWCASHPAEAIHGVVVSDRFAQAAGPPHQEWPAVDGSVHPVALLTEACMHRVHPTAVTPRQIARFIPREFAGQKNTDPLAGSLAGQLAVVVAKCATTHAVTTWLMEDQDWDLMAVHYDVLDGFSRTVRAGHQPKMGGRGGEDFGRYGDVMTECYRFCDTMLGRLMDLIEDDATIILFSAGDSRTDGLQAAGCAKTEDRRPTAQHGQQGMLVMAGPNIKKAQRVDGASALDITPTVLWLLGRPVATDMGGKPLTHIRDADGEAEVAEVETYETAGPVKGAAPL